MERQKELHKVKRKNEILQNMEKIKEHMEKREEENKLREEELHRVKARKTLLQKMEEQSTLR